jgi:DNA-binding response OmpR family regulator
MRVLIVEDEPDVADFLARALREAAWAPDVAREPARHEGNGSIARVNDRTMTGPVMLPSPRREHIRQW